MSSLEWMPDLAAALDEFVPLDGSSRADWHDVVARTHKRHTLLQIGRRRPHWSPRLAIVLALLVLLLVGCATVTYLLLRGNGGIAFEGNAGRLLIVAPDGSQLQGDVACSQPRHFACLIKEPAWSPDGTRVAFVAGGYTPGFSLYVAAADGTGVRKLARCESCGVLSDGNKLAWSPNGRWIVFNRDANHQDSLWIVASTGGTPHRLSRCRRCGDDRPAWSPNGRLLLFQRADGSALSGYSLYTIRPDGSHVTKIRSNAADAAWSPDGHRIAFDTIRFLRRKDGSLYWDQGGIAVVDADGSHPRLLTPGRWARGRSPSDPAWSPDGRKLAFIRVPVGGSSLRPYSGSKEEIWTMSADGSDKKRLYHARTGDTYSAPPIWSPDGQLIAFGSSGIFVINADGTGLKKISPVFVQQLSWQPRPSDNK